MANDGNAQLSSAELPKGKASSAEAESKEENKAVRKEASVPDEDSTKEPSAPKIAAGDVKQGMLPPAVRKAPVPRFNAGSNYSASKTSTDPADTNELAAAKRAKAAALASASRAGRNVTPAQREKAIAEAAAAAAAAYAASKSESATANTEPEYSTSAAGNGQHGDSSRQAVSYSEPEWGGMPSRQDFSLETMKGGRIIEEKTLRGKSCFTIGRAATCDFMMEHPSISRLHAVLQFGTREGAPSIYDCGSIHGTFLNKGRLKAKTYASLSVGDMVKFGQSSRMFILGGPSELMPEEGLSKTQTRQLAALEAKEKRKTREEEIAKAQMAAALNRGISWGMDEDAIMVDDDDDDDGVPSVEWRAYAQTHTLTDNQQKLADKLRRLENRIRNLTTEADRIKAKQGSMEDLTAGQAAQLARNEQIIDKASEEFEDLEEMLNESIAESLRGKRGKLEAEASKKRRTRVDEEEDSGSEEDEFYDRTAPGKSKKRKAAAVVHDAASLFGRKEALLEEKGKVEAQLAEELAADAGADSAPSSKGGLREAAADPLDAFMSGVTVELEQSKIDKLRKDVAEITGEIENLEALLKQADPDGYYREGTHAAKVAREKGLRLFNQDKERKAALENKKRQEAAKTAAAEKAARLFVPENEEEEVEVSPPAKSATEKAAAAEKAALGMVHRLEAPSAEVGGLEIRKTAETEKPKSAAAFAPAQTEQPPAPEAGLRAPKAQSPSTKEQRDAMIRAALAKEEAAKSKAQKGGGPEGQDALLADLALLKKAASATDEAEAEGEAAAWKPPSGQSGDGRTSLNQKLGY